MVMEGTCDILVENNMLSFNEDDVEKILGNRMEKPFPISIWGFIIASPFAYLLYLGINAIFFWRGTLARYGNSFMTESATKELNNAIIMVLIFSIITAGILYTSYALVNGKYSDLKEERKTEAKKKVYEQKASEIILKSKVPKNAIQIKCFKGLNHIIENMQKKQPPVKPAGNDIWICLWKYNEDLMYTYNIMNYNAWQDSSVFYYDSMGEIQNKFLDTFSDGLPHFKIKYDDIFFYAREGDFYIKTDVRGSGGGSDYGRAFVGGILFGGAGAIVASRQDVQINTTTTEVDKRDTRLFYKYNNKIIDAHFSSDTYEIFRNLLPDKDAKVIERLSKSIPEKADKIASTVDRTEEKGSILGIEDDVYTKLDKLNALKEKGIITEEEYGEKKRKLLDQI